MDRTGSRKQKIKDIAYLVISVLIVIALLVGISITKDDIFPFSEYKDSFWVALPYTIIIFLLVQMIFVTTIGMVRQCFISFTAIALSSFVSFQCTFAIISLPRDFPIHHGMSLFDEIGIDLCRPAGMVWANYGTRWPLPDANPVIFVVLATAFLTVFEYFWLRKRTEKKKALFFAILITSFVLCTALSIFMQIAY